MNWRFFKATLLIFLFKLNQKATSLCQRFTKFVTKYDLMTNDSLIVPIQQDGASNNEEQDKSKTESEA